MRSGGEVYQSVGAVANRWLDIIETKGAFLTTQEVIDVISERKSMSKSVNDSGDVRTTASRFGSRAGARPGVH